jgi:tetratricopeptide (TPR) repeat protein
MKIVYRWLKSILGSAMPVLLASCVTPAPYSPNDSTVGNMNVEQARQVLVTVLPMKGLYGRVFNMAVGEPYYNVDITSVRVTPTKFVLSNTSGIDIIVSFSKLPQMTVGYGVGGLGDTVQYIKITDKQKLSIHSANKNVANALYVLKQNAKKVADEYDASFAASLADYRNKATSNAALPEEANKYKVQAEGAVRDKQFNNAADLYTKALEIVPWWPVGHFNRALVLGETGDYAEAQREMKHYLQLVPDAPNKRAAQDKVYDWERLEAK